jgi:hypothetical protein
MEYHRCPHNPELREVWNFRDVHTTLSLGDIWNTMDVHTTQT